jgi:hypothetical protein
MPPEPVNIAGAQKFSGFERMQAMPGLADKLNNAEIAELVNYLRQTWGGHRQIQKSSHDDFRETPHGTTHRQTPVAAVWPFPGG